MRNLRNFGLLAATILLAAWPAASQFTMRTPDFRGVFAPVVGTGSAYQVTTPQGNSEMEITVVGKEDVAGKTGYWMEIGMNPPRGGQMYIKDLMVIDGPTTTVTRMIMQMAGRPPMDMSAMMSAAAATQTKQAIDSRAEADKVGTESVTTPAGTFDCDHYKAKDGSWEAWISTKISPWGLVKSSGSGTSMVLTRVISNATDHITGTPQQFNFPGGPPPGAGPR